MFYFFLFYCGIAGSFCCIYLLNTYYSLYFLCALLFYKKNQQFVLCGCIERPVGSGSEKSVCPCFRVIFGHFLWPDYKPDYHNIQAKSFCFYKGRKKMQFWIKLHDLLRSYLNYIWIKFLTFSACRSSLVWCMHA